MLPRAPAEDVVSLHRTDNQLNLSGPNGCRPQRGGLPMVDEAHVERLRNLRVCIYGGTDLQGMPEKFISALAYKILELMPAVIVTGGFLRSNKKPNAVSTDVAALNGARSYAEKHGIDLKNCYEAWIPDLDDRADVGGAVRMTDNDITVRVMTGRTSLGRRLAMAAGVHMVITISGRKHTEVVIEQALELGIPTLPIPNAGGDSKDLLERHRERIAASFGPRALDKCLNDVSNAIHHKPEAAASSIVDLIRTAKIGRCLVLFPYDDEHNKLYASVIQPAVATHMMPVRLDRLPTSEVIFTGFADAIRSSSAVIADITRLNENVMYEVGFAHGYGVRPLIYTREASRLERLPVYFRTLNVRIATEETPVKTLIDEYLRSLKSPAASERTI
jgi:hypothetical protein